MRAHVEAELIVSPRVKRERVYIGWLTTGGVLFMKLDADELWKTQLGMLPMALNMDEYCKVLELNGARFYEDPKDCGYLADLVGSVYTRARGVHADVESTCARGGYAYKPNRY